MDSAPLKRKLFGRRLTRGLSAHKQSLIDDVLPLLQPPKEGPVALPSLPLWIEIGFGNGEHLRGLIEKHPDKAFIGAEPFMNGMAAFLATLAEKDLPRVRVWMDDALLLLTRLPDGCAERIYLLNPDPWPKKRHHKRRFINPENLDLLARLLKPGGQLVMATDVDDLAEWMVTQTVNHPAFRWTARCAADWRETPPGWIETKYERKGRAQGRRQSYLIFEAMK